MCKKKTVIFDYPENNTAQLYLTVREKEFVRAIFNHFTMKRVAREMNITPHTASAYARDLRLKMGVDNTIAAAYKARDLSLLD